MAPTTAWSVVRPEIAQELGYVSFTTTTDIAANNSIIATGLTSRFPIDNYFNGWWVIILGTANDRVVRRVTDYAQSTGTLTVSGPVLAAETGAQTVQLHRFAPDTLQTLFNRARQDLFPQIAMLREYVTLVGQRQNAIALQGGTQTLPRGPFRGPPLEIWQAPLWDVVDIPENLITNPGFEDWTNSSTLVGWTLTGTGAATRQVDETTSPRNYMVLRGASSCRVAAQLDTATTLLQDIRTAVTGSTAMFADVTRTQITFGIWVYCTLPSRVTAQISGGGITSTPRRSATHDGAGWQFLMVSAVTLSGLLALDVGISISSGAAMEVFIDEAFAFVGQQDRASDAAWGTLYSFVAALRPIWAPLHGWRWVPPPEGINTNGMVEFPYTLPEKTVVRIVGRDMVSSVSAEADTVELTGPQLDVLYNRTRAMAMRELQFDAVRGEVTAQPPTFFQQKAREFEDRVQDALNGGNFTPAPRPLPVLPDGDY